MDSGERCNTNLSKLSYNFDVDRIRNTYGTDIIIYIVTDNTTTGFRPWGDDVIGCANEVHQNDIMNGRKGYVAIAAASFNHPFVLTHEIGHVFGANHLNGSTLLDCSKDPTRCAYAYQLGDAVTCYNENQQQYVSERPYTIMDGIALNETIRYFSNPDGQFQGTPLGVRNDYPDKSHNNLGQVRAVGELVQRYQHSDDINPLLNIDHSASQVSHVEAIINEGSVGDEDEYTFEWLWSVDGFFTDSYPGESFAWGHNTGVVRRCCMNIWDKARAHMPINYAAFCWELGIPWAVI